MVKDGVAAVTTVQNVVTNVSSRGSCGSGLGNIVPRKQLKYNVPFLVVLHCPQTVRLFRSVASTATFVQCTRNVNGPTEFLAAAESHCEPSINFLFEKNESTTVLLRHVFGFAKKKYSCRRIRL